MRWPNGYSRRSARRMSPTCGRRPSRSWSSTGPQGRAPPTATVLLTPTTSRASSSGRCYVGLASDYIVELVEVLAARRRRVVAAGEELVHDRHQPLVDEAARVLLGLPDVQDPKDAALLVPARRMDDQTFRRLALEPRGDSVVVARRAIAARDLEFLHESDCHAGLLSPGSSGSYDE